MHRYRHRDPRVQWRVEAKVAKSTTMETASRSQLASLMIMIKKRCVWGSIWESISSTYKCPLNSLNTTCITSDLQEHCKAAFS